MNAALSFLLIFNIKTSFSKYERKSFLKKCTIIRFKIELWK